MTITDWLEVIIPLIVLLLLYAWGIGRINGMIIDDMPRGKP